MSRRVSLLGVGLALVALGLAATDVALGSGQPVSRSVLLLADRGGRPGRSRPAKDRAAARVSPREQTRAADSKTLPG
jgi:hypothetical protein